MTIFRRHDGSRTRFRSSLLESVATSTRSLWSIGLKLGASASPWTVKRRWAGHRTGGAGPFVELPRGLIASCGSRRCPRHRGRGRARRHNRATAAPVFSTARNPGKRPPRPG